MKAIQLNCLFLILLCAAPVNATSEPTKEKPPKPTAEGFVFSNNGADVASATLRVSVRKNGRFASWKVKAKAEGFTPIWALHQKRADGALLKYQRLEDRRLGPGVIAFSKGNMVRIVGKNQKRAPIEIETAYHALWDPKTWIAMWDWPRRLGKAGDSVRMAIYNVETGKMGAVEGTRGSATVYKVKDGTVVQVTKWSLTGLGERALTLFVNADGKLVYVSDGERAMRRQGVSLTPPPPPAEESGDDDKNEGEKPEGTEG